MTTFTVSPVGNITVLRNLIQSVSSGDIIELTSGSSAPNYSTITTLAKIPSRLNSVYQSGYTIDGINQIRTTITNTRIFQQGVDGFYAPSMVKNLRLNYTSASAGSAVRDTAILRATQGSYTLDMVNITGNHKGWAGNGGVYMSLTTSNGAAPIAANLTLKATSVSLDANSQTNGTASFLQSWNNTGTVTLDMATFREEGFSRGSFHFASMNGNSGNLGTYVVKDSSFVGNGTIKSNSNRLESVNATVTGTTFQDGSYLDLAGNLNGITINGGNMFKTLYGDTSVSPFTGSGIRFTRLSSSGATLSGSPIAISGNSFEGYGLAISNNDTVPTSGGSVIIVGSNQVSLGMVGNTGVITETFSRLSAGGVAADTLNYSASANNEWISGAAGNDSLTGGSGNDFLIGGVGSDTIATGSGSDNIVYYATNEGGDTITDFAPGTDKLAFRGNGQGGSDFFDFAEGTSLTPGSNFITSGAIATSPIPTFIYFGGVLSYDADGSGSGAAVNIATFSGSPTIAASDIQFF